MSKTLVDGKLFFRAKRNFRACIESRVLGMKSGEEPLSGRWIHTQVLPLKEESHALVRSWSRPGEVHCALGWG